MLSDIIIFTTYKKFFDEIYLSDSMAFGLRQIKISIAHTYIRGYKTIFVLNHFEQYVVKMAEKHKFDL